MNFNFKQTSIGFICGAGHGIGLGLTKVLLENYPQLKIHATYRVEHRAEQLLQLHRDYHERLFIHQVDPTKESEINDLVINLKRDEVKIDFILNSVGLLHSEGIHPEKSLRNFNSETFLEVMKVNTVVTPLLAKTLEKVTDKTTLKIFATISAKVGSIQDNKIGGWYSYRASKAALNMLIKNISIEFERKKNNTICLAIHPGTTITDLSKPFIAKTKYQLHSIEECAQNIINVINSKRVEDNGSFYSWDNEELPW